MAAGGIQTMQQFIPVRTPTANEKLSEGMLEWSLVLPPVTNILTQAAQLRRGVYPVRYTPIAPHMIVGGSGLLPKDFTYSTVNETPAASSTTTSGQTGNPANPGGTASAAPTPAASTATPAQPVSYAIYSFSPRITNSVATVTQIRSIVVSLSYFMAHWTFAIWIPSLQRYTEFIPSAQSPIQAWSTTNAAYNVEASGNATVEFIFGLLVDPTTAGLTAPYGNILVNNFEIKPHLYVTFAEGGLVATVNSVLAGNLECGQ